ncbi:iqgap-related protein [Cryomyces antarcticus]|nr:iqgap-related protein [Cryomyces antarcticus]
MVSVPSPLRYTSTASTSSSTYSTYSDPFPPSRTSTVTSNGSLYGGAGHKRGLSEATSPTKSPLRDEYLSTAKKDLSPSSTYKSMRQSLRSLPQAPARSPSGIEKSPTSLHRRSQNLEPTALAYDGTTSPTSRLRQDSAITPPVKTRPHSMAISRSDSVRAPMRDGLSRGNSQRVHFNNQSSLLDTPDLQSLNKSSTSHLRTLSKFAKDGSEEDFAIKTPEQEVAGLHGRRKLQRTMSTRDKKPGATSGWQRSIWMDQQRQFLQAYEYLCHIGEAKEWIEDIIQMQIPPIVQLEEALRDGVTLAEVVQAMHPEKPLRIFRHPKLQFRHSDNIALFFRFLSEVDLPELFRFELVDLYEKKNIPKVIYCIHALSWLLFRKGIVDFRIGNLVGKLQFEDHELEAMQKGLDKAGISMPNFSGMSANFGAEPDPIPEPEPVESEEDRIHRELGKNEEVILDLQAQIRGSVVRLRLGDKMQDLWDAEEMLVDLQSRIRGDWARQISQYRLDMKRFATTLQSASRGFLVRSRERSKESYFRDREGQVVALQSLIRACKVRTNVQHLKSKVQRQERGIRQLQAAIRGILKRWDIGDEYYEIREAESEVQGLQAAIRGSLARQRVELQLVETREAEPVIRSLQAAIRGASSRKRVDEQHADTRSAECQSQIRNLQAAVRGMMQRRAVQVDRVALRQYEDTMTKVQSAFRAMSARQQHHSTQRSLQSRSSQWGELQSVTRARALRHSLKELRRALHDQRHSVTSLQAAVRGVFARQGVALTRAALASQEHSILETQSRIRGHLLRQRHVADLRSLDRRVAAITELQALSRAYVASQRTFELLCKLNDQELEIIALQSLARAMLLRAEVGTLLFHIENEEELIVELQAAARGKLVREKFAEKKRFFKQNMEKVIKIQSFVRGRQQGEAYKSLTTGKNPPVGTVKNFVHLLNDSDFDFDEEMEFERLRKTVVQHVRQNEMAEQYIDQLDIKIALLVKNKITLDEVVKHQKHFGGHVGSLLTNKEISSKDPFDLKALNKNSRRKLEHYQELFFILQTQPQYLARMFRKIREQGTAETECKRVETLMLGLFGFAQKRREEYYLLKLISRSVKEELDCCASLQDYLRGNFFWSKIMNAYTRTPRDRKYMRDLMGPVIKENIIENDGLDLESDPMQIYRSAINNEELRTGQRSRRIPDIPREQAIRDPETRDTFIAHLQDLRDICDQFFASLEETLHRMPYGTRFIAQQTFELLRAKFPHESPQHLLRIVGHWISRTYLQPALAEPQMWGVVDRGLSPIHKRNLGEVGKVVGQIAAGRLFGGENVYLQPLNTYVTEAISRLEEIWSNVINVRDAEKQFDIDEFNDLYSRTKPTLYIKMADIFAIHQLVASDITYLCPAQDDTLREVIRELGSAKNNENEMMGVSSAEISLTLNPKLHDVEDPDAAIKSLFMETKRCVLYIIRIQSGSNLMEIMVRPIHPDDEDRWDALIREELLSHNTTTKRGAYTESTALVDITTMSYAELKRTALENILELERHGRLSRHNHYQDLLNAIAIDIRTKHRRRVDRARELEGVRATLSQLDAKAAWLDQQLKSYNDYIEQAMMTLQNKKGKKRFLMPFTKQYNHEKELQRSGRVPKFGSFKYSARTLAEKGVLVSWAGYTERQWDKINLTVSSDEVGIFHIEGSSGSLMIPGASASVPLDDLLQAQFNNHQFMNLFASGSGGAGDGLRLNVNLFLHLVFKKFYRDE